MSNSTTGIELQGCAAGGIRGVVGDADLRRQEETPWRGEALVSWRVRRGPLDGMLFLRARRGSAHTEFGSGKRALEGRMSMGSQEEHSVALVTLHLSVRGPVGGCAP